MFSDALKSSHRIARPHIVAQRPSLAGEACSKAASATPVPAGGPIRLRSGVNLGEVIVEEDGDVFGEGVNVAARLEQMAEPGKAGLPE